MWTNWDLPWCFVIFLRRRRPKIFQFCWIRRVSARCWAQGSVSDGLHQNTVLSEPRVRPEKWLPESSSSRTSSLQPAEPHFSKMLAASGPGRAGPCAAPSAITMLPQLSLRPDSESCSLSSPQIWTSFFPGTTNNLRCPHPATRPGRSAGRAGPGRGGFSSPGSGSSGGKLRRPSYYGGAGRATPHRPARPRL